MATETSKTLIGVDEQHRVVVTHDRPVGTQYMTPAQARTMARALIQAADMAEAQGN